MRKNRKTKKFNMWSKTVFITKFRNDKDVKWREEKRGGLSPSWSTLIKVIELIHRSRQINEHKDICHASAINNRVCIYEQNHIQNRNFFFSFIFFKNIQEQKRRKDIRTTIREEGGEIDRKSKRNDKTMINIVSSIRFTPYLPLLYSLPVLSVVIPRNFNRVQYYFCNI